MVSNVCRRISQLRVLALLLQAFLRQIHDQFELEQKLDPKQRTLKEDLLTLSPAKVRSSNALLLFIPLVLICLFKLIVLYLMCYQLSYDA